MTEEKLLLTTKIASNGFGGTGDLAMSRLLPSLYHRDSDGQLTAGHR